MLSHFLGIRGVLEMMSGVYCEILIRCFQILKEKSFFF